MVKRNGIRTPQLTEPDTVPEYFITGAEIDVPDGIVRFVAYVEPPNFGIGQHEQRIVSRLSMAKETWREIIAISRKKPVKRGR